MTTSTPAKKPPPDFSKINILVNGAPVTADINEILTITDLDLALRTIGAEIAYWSAIWGEAEAEKERVDADYRTWRAKLGQDMMAGEKSMPEWKVKNAIEADPMFLNHKKVIALAERNSVLIKGVVDGLKAKAQALSTKGNMMSAELRSTGMTITAHALADDAKSADKVEKGKAAMKEAFTKKKADG